MVTAQTQLNLVNAKSYFQTHLSAGDYYDQNQTIAGQWLGAGAAQLGLAGTVQRADFLALCDNLHPATKETLTQRQRSASDRRVFYDFTISPPKSVSIVALVLDNREIVEVHRKSVETAMRELERFAGCRVRKDRADADRFTQNTVSALFTHDTSRALDPHLHTHCIVFNATWDPKEGRWKALQNFEMLRARGYAQEVYYHELARGLKQLGYTIRNRAMGDFQINGVSDQLCTLFSKRHQQIDRNLRQLLEEKPELAQANQADLRERIAELSRERKIQDLDPQTLRELWKNQIPPKDWVSLQNLRHLSESQTTTSSGKILEEAIQWAEEHVFDRNSVVLECQLKQMILQRARGQEVSLPLLEKGLSERNYVRHPDRPHELTKRDVLLREWIIVESAKSGLGQCGPLAQGPVHSSRPLDPEQSTALYSLLRSTNMVTLFRGGAGTGKSFVLRELVDQIQGRGLVATVLAPQRQQVVDMEKSGFPCPFTVSRFLRKPELVPGSVVIVDESGQIGGKQMLALIREVRRSNARLILSGDTRQHGPVEASDALLAIQKYSGVQPIQIQTIRRQDPSLGKSLAERASIRGYRKAVESAAQGKLAESFHQLERLGSIIRCPLHEQSGKLAESYVELAQAKESVVVVSQTWAEVDRVNKEVRNQLKARGLLGSSDTRVEVLERRDLTNAQKRDSRYHGSDDVIVLNQPFRGLAAGTQGNLKAVLPSKLLLQVKDRLVALPNQHLDKIQVCMRKQIHLTHGDRIQIKANRSLGSGGRLNNGELVSVDQIHKDGRISLQDGRTLDPHMREFMLGYAVTSYGSQGKTVDHVLFSDSTSKAATNAQQWYVTISRGRKSVKIFTSDPSQLKENLARSGQRKLALDLRIPTEALIRVVPGMHRIWRGFGTKVRQLLERGWNRMRHCRPTVIHYGNTHQAP